ncbi:MAG: hypothetical protein U9R53_11085, partial [Chloroflexota bacterium]|nr:hypothetical protein [Chloroflexota bacterium]
LPSKEISRAINAFGEGFNTAVFEIIKTSKTLDKNGALFNQCSSRILGSFKMTRSGIFHKKLYETLSECWRVIGKPVLDIKQQIQKTDKSRDRYLLEISEIEREKVVSEIWQITKALLPITMGKYSYGLVGASKILFSVLPEIVLPVDNVQWK